MLKSTTTVAALFLVACGALLALSLSHVSSGDRESYLQLVEKTEETGEGRQMAPGLQLRRGVSKDLYLMENGQRLHSHFESEGSIVEFTFRHGQAELEERMEQVVGTVQDELFYKMPDGGEATRLATGAGRLRDGGELLDVGADWEPMQHVRHIESSNASYQFHTGRFAGRDVTFRREAAAGHDLAESGNGQELLRGQARDVELCLGKERVDFRASRLRATISSPKGML